MADVFLSYARGDRIAAERLASAIGEAGLSVWWDRHIKGGADFSHDIERHLNDASKVLVLWSKEAVHSRWVRDEASVAADSGRLVGATIDGTPPPLGFRQFQTIDLTRWAAKGAAIPDDLAEALEVEQAPPTAPRDAASSARRPRVIAAAVGAALLIGAATVAIVRPAPFDSLLSGEEQRKELSLAIMPFATQGGGDYVGAGLAGALADTLVQLSGLKITSSTSTKAVAALGLTAPEIGRKLNISHLVEGDIQRSGDRYTISVRLVEAATSEQVWARTLEGAAEELQQLKSRLARELAGALQARLGVGQGEIVERSDIDPRAYEAYLRALERLSVRDHDGSRVEAIKQFRLAATIQPDFADAHAGHAYLLALTVPWQVGMSWPELEAEQRRATARALELDPNNDLALIAKATALKNFDGDVNQALAIDEAVVERSPNFAQAHYSRAGSLWLSGQAREALHHLDLAIEQDPVDSNLRFYRSKILYALGDYPGVREAAKNCQDPCVAIGWYWFMALMGHGTHADFRADLPALLERARVLGMPPDGVRELGQLAEAFVVGRPIKSPPPPDDRIVDFIDGAIEARLGSFDTALRYTRTAADRHQADSVLDILNEGRVTFTPEQRADPRYHELFRHPKLVKIAAARRERGVLAGLPLFPVRPYSGR